MVRWLDRLGRNYEDVCDTIREFMRRGVVIRTVINNFTFDGATKDPMQQASRRSITSSTNMRRVLPFSVTSMTSRSTAPTVLGPLGRPDLFADLIAFVSRSCPPGRFR